MQVGIKTHAYPRAAVIGNPSDGYGGKTIAFVFSNFQVDVQLSPGEKLTIISKEEGTSIYYDMASLKKDIQLNGYKGKHVLIKALIHKFSDYLAINNHKNKSNFTIKYRSSIPRQLGLAGSSAIITAGLRALLHFYQRTIQLPFFANFVLEVETKYLGIAAGLQDRVAQAFEQPVYMDFNNAYMAKYGHGRYETFSPDLFPSFYLAYKNTTAEDSDVVHNDLKERYAQGDKSVVRAMDEFAQLTTDAYQVLQKHQLDELGALINQNFDLRASICKLPEAQVQMVHTARSCGASAKFTGSGGAIIGTYRDGEMFQFLSQNFSEQGVQILKPEIVHS